MMLLGHGDETQGPAQDQQVAVGRRQRREGFLSSHGGQEDTKTASEKDPFLV